jgi:hypothetical protein
MEIPRQPPGVPVMPRDGALITAPVAENKEMPQRPDGGDFFIPWKGEVEK